MSSRSASTGVSTRSTPSARCSASPAALRRRPMLSFIPELGSTLHLVGVCVNRIGKVCTKIAHAILDTLGRHDGSAEVLEAATAIALLNPQPAIYDHSFMANFILVEMH